jgi:S-methyl-5-thioribose-1-phosphate isomerase
MLVNGVPYRTVWLERDVVCIIDQHALPFAFRIVRLTSVGAVADAIRTMRVRGAPAIGAAGAFGLALAAQHATDENFNCSIATADALLRATRPTARDLFAALDAVHAAILSVAGPDAARRAARDAAMVFADANVAACRAIGDHGAELIRDGMTILTHCNAGWLATVDWGTALAPIYVAARQGKRVRVLADETRPRCQGARLTAWELHNAGIDVAIISDNAAGHFLSTGQIQLCIVGADRVAANGDVANKIGTFEKAVVAQACGVPFYVAAPASTIDPACPSGAEIPIEQRAPAEVLEIDGIAPDGACTSIRIAPDGVHALNPAFDVTPARYITGLITERGIIRAADAARAG